MNRALEKSPAAPAASGVCGDRFCNNAVDAAGNCVIAIVFYLVFFIRIRNTLFLNCFFTGAESFAYGPAIAMSKASQSL
jgi:hypothetical protein